MIETPQDPRGTGGSVYGDSGITLREENRLIGMAVRQQWKLDESAKEEAVAITRKNLHDPCPRVANQAVRNFIAMNSQNMEQEARDNPKPTNQPPVNVNVTLVSSLRAELVQHDPEYVDVVRRRMLEATGGCSDQSGGVCGHGEPGAVEDGPASGLPGPSANGHH